MSPSTESLERRRFAFELKYLIPAGRAGAIRQWARERLPADPNGSGQAGDTYLTTSLYFDTPGFDVYRRNGSFGRAKYRIRRYWDGPAVFLERKMKKRNLVSKRRTILDLDELERLSGPLAGKGWSGFWFHRRLLARGLAPVCQISYERTARVLMTPAGAIRLTLDQDLRAVPVRGIEFQSRDNALPLGEGHAVLELKYRYAMPTLFKQLLAEFPLHPRPFSKYRMAIQELGLLPADCLAAVYA
jgi:hypothetical protein